MSHQKTPIKPGSEKRSPVQRRKRRRVGEADEMIGSAFNGGSHEAQINNLQHLSRPQQQTALRNISKVQGNRRASRVANHLQRHPGHGALSPEGEEMVGNMAANVQLTPAIMRAELITERTELATVNAAAAPLALRDGFLPISPSLGDLAAGDRVRILGRLFGRARIHVESGVLAGQVGFVTTSDLTTSPDPTSTRTPNVGTEDAYTQLQTELAQARPDRFTIFDILELRMTRPQQQRLLQAGNAEYVALQGLGVITANDLLHILNILGARLHRKITDYLDKRGRSIEELRLVFATAVDDERTEVAQDDALVGRLRPILGSTHPEIIFGPVLATLYPPDGKVMTLAATNPNLARWLRNFVTRRQDLNALATARAQGLQNAANAIAAETPARAKRIIMAAIEAAPRGAALPATERTALDTIEEHAYNQGNYTSGDLGKMFVTRWGRPFRRAASQTKTFLHRIWQTLKTLPDDNVLLNNVLARLDENKDPDAAGSFTDWLGDRSFGSIRSDRPTATSPFHAASNQNGRSIEVVEPHLDLLQRGNNLRVTEADGSQTVVTVRSVNVPRKTIRVSASVNVNAGAEIVNTTASASDRGEAIRITAASPLFPNVANAPDLAHPGTTLQPGTLFSKTAERNVAGVIYWGGRVYEGGARQQVGWIAAAGGTSLGGTTMGEEEFAWTLRHEMGHALDLQVNGFSSFSTPSVAQWRKYTGVSDWVNDLIATAAVANPATNATYGGVTSNFRQAARTYSEAVQDDNATAAAALNAQTWLRGWRTAGGSAAVYDIVTQFDADPDYYNRNAQGIPPVGGRIFGAHYGEWFGAIDAARVQSLAVGVSPYAYTCTYEFFADHYAAYTGPGTGGQRYARAVPGWAQNFFDRLVGQAGSGPRVGMKRHRMDRG